MGGFDDLGCATACRDRQGTSESWRLSVVTGRCCLLLVIFYLGLIVGGWFTGQWFTGLAAFDVNSSNELEVNAMVMMAVGVYAAASAIPFVPGAEIGFALVLALGIRIVFLVYIAMVGALLLAFFVGRFVPARVTASAFDFLGLHKARDLVLKMAPLTAQDRLALLTDRAPARIIPFLLRHRYIALAVLINLPGNTLVGGGGGIALAAGMSGVYSTAAYMVTIVLAVAPLPILILFTGYHPGG